MQKIKFYKRANCSNCKKMTEVVDNLGIEVEYIDGDSNKEEVNKLAPEGKWQLPLIALYENNILMGVSTGIVNPDDLTLAFRPLMELQALAYETLQGLKNIDNLKAQLENKYKALENIISLKQAPVETKVVPDIVDPADETQCDSCQ